MVGSFVVEGDAISESCSEDSATAPNDPLCRPETLIDYDSDDEEIELSGSIIASSEKLVTVALNKPWIGLR